MSQPTTAGRGGRQNLSSSRFGGSDGGVTVKTLSSNSTSSPTLSGPKRLLTSKDENAKTRKDIGYEHSKSFSGRNGELHAQASFSNQKSKVFSQSISASPSVASSTTKRKEGTIVNQAPVTKNSIPHGSAPKNDRERKYSGPDDRDIEVRTHGNGGGFSRNGGRGMNPIRSKSERSQYQSSSTRTNSSASAQHVRASGRAINTERVSNETTGRSTKLLLTLLELLLICCYKFLNIIN